MAYLSKYDELAVVYSFDKVLCSTTQQPGKLMMNMCFFNLNRHILCEKNEPEEAQESLHGISGRRRIQLSKPTLSSGKNITKIVCPSDHWTREFLACDVRSACEQTENYVRYSKISTNGSLPSLCLSFFSTLFACRTGVERVSYSLVCDHSQDCPDASDEDFCVHPPCSISKQFECVNKQVRNGKKCV